MFKRDTAWVSWRWRGRGRPGAGAAPRPTPPRSSPGCPPGSPSCCWPGSHQAAGSGPAPAPGQQLCSVTGYCAVLTRLRRVSVCLAVEEARVLRLGLPASRSSVLPSLPHSKISKRELMNTALSPFSGPQSDQSRKAMPALRARKAATEPRLASTASCILLTLRPVPRSGNRGPGRAGGGGGGGAAGPGGGTVTSLKLHQSTASPAPRQ